MIDAVLRITIVVERSLGLVFTPDGVLLRVPTTRRIAERLGVPHSYVLPVIGALQAGGDLTRAERVGSRMRGSSTAPGEPASERPVHHGHARASTSG